MPSAAEPKPRNTTTARRVFTEKLNERLLAEIDPDGNLSENERAERLHEARSEYFARLGTYSVDARKAAALVNYVSKIDFGGIQAKIEAVRAAAQASDRANRELASAVAVLDRNFA